MYCRIEIKKFTLNGVIYTYQDNVTDGTWEAASTKYQYQDGNGNIVNLKVTANTLFNDSGEYVQIASSGSYAISASLVFVDQSLQMFLGHRKLLFPSVETRFQNLQHLQQQALLMTAIILHGILELI